MNQTQTEVVRALNDHKDHVINVVAGVMIHLGSRPEWSMEDNFVVTERIAQLASECGLPAAGDQSDEDLAFWRRGS